MWNHRGNSAEVGCFRSGVTNTEKCVREFVALLLERERIKSGTQGEVADLRVLN